MTEITPEMDEWGRQCSRAFEAAVREWAKHTDVSSLSEKDYKAAVQRLAFEVVTNNPAPWRKR